MFDVSHVRRFSLMGWFSRRPVADPLARTMRRLERQGGTLVAVAHACATVMIVLFSLGSLVALSGDSFATLVLTVRHGGMPGIPQAISIAVSTLMVVCCDVGLIYAAMVLRALRTRGAPAGYLLHSAVLVVVAAIEAGTYLYMSARYEQPTGWAWALILARASAAPLLSVYLAMAAKLPITSRDMLHQAELWQGMQLVREVIAVAADPAAPLADKMELYEQSAVMTPADRQRLQAMIAVVQRRQVGQTTQATQAGEVGQAGQAGVYVVPAADTQALVPVPAAAGIAPPSSVDQGDAEEVAVEQQPPMLRYNGRRIAERVEATQ
jgi:hypothetical protein